MDKIIDTQIVERWKTFRMRYINKNQAEAAEILGISAAGLSYIENGKRAINYKVVRVAVDKYGLNSKWLSTGKGDPIKPKEKPTLLTDIAELRSEQEIQLNMIKIMGVQLNNLYKAVSKLEKGK